MAVLDHREGLGLAPTEAPRRATSARRGSGERLGRPPRVALAAPVRPCAASCVDALAAVLVRRRRPTSAAFGFDGPCEAVLHRRHGAAAGRVGARRRAQPGLRVRGSSGVGSEEFRRVARAGIALTAIVAFTAYATQIEVARHYVLISLPAGHRPDPRRSATPCAVAAPAPRQGRVPAPRGRGRPRAAGPRDAPPPRRRAVPRPPGRGRVPAAARPAPRSDGARRPRRRRLRLRRAGGPAHRRRHRRRPGQPRPRPRAAAPAGLGPRADRCRPAGGARRWSRWPARV